MKHVLVSSSLPPSMRKTLGRFGKVSVLKPHPSLPSPIASHPDTLFASVGDGIFTYPDYTDGIALLGSLGVGCSVVSCRAGNVYPLDAQINCFELGGALFCRAKSTANELLAKAGKVADVNQGYAHCSSAVFGDSLITSDIGIYEKARSLSIDALLISPGGVSLDGYGCGFIGGACGQICHSAVFFGDPRLHPDGKRIVDFVNSKGFEVVPLGDGPLADHGSLIFIETEK